MNLRFTLFYNTFMALWKEFRNALFSTLLHSFFRGVTQIATQFCVTLYILDKIIWACSPLFRGLNKPIFRL